MHVFKHVRFMCMSVHLMLLCCLQSPGEGSSGSIVTDDCEPLCGSWNWAAWAFNCWALSSPYMFFWDRVSCSPNQLWTLHVAEDVHLLLLHPEGWDYRGASMSQSLQSWGWKLASLCQLSSIPSSVSLNFSSEELQASRNLIKVLLQVFHRCMKPNRKGPEIPGQGESSTCPEQSEPLICVGANGGAVLEHGCSQSCTSAPDSLCLN